eukprot:12536580-Heterocapsa_arctica.AAC.1
MQHDMLHVGLGHRVVSLEEEDVRSTCLCTTRLGDAPHVHPVDVEGHGAQLLPTARVVVGRVRARGAGFHLLDVD